MPDDLNIAQLGLLTEGVEIETFPTSPVIPAEAGYYLVKVMARPTSTGDLIVSGEFSYIKWYKFLQECLVFNRIMYLYA